MPYDRRLEIIYTKQVGAFGDSICGWEFGTIRDVWICFSGAQSRVPVTDHKCSEDVQPSVPALVFISFLAAIHDLRLGLTKRNKKAVPKADRSAGLGVSSTACCLWGTPIVGHWFL